MTRSVTIDRAAYLLGRSRRTVYNRIKSGILRTTPAGISRRVTVESLVQQPEFASRQTAVDQWLPMPKPIHYPNRT